MKSKCLLFLTLCLFFNACSNEDELMTPDSKRGKREVRERISVHDEISKPSSFETNIIYDAYFHFGHRGDTKEWERIMNFQPGYAVFDKIKRLNFPASSEWSIQDIAFAFGSVVNMDYFPVTIEKMPTVNGKELSPLEFFEHVRKNLDDFVAFYTGVKFRSMDEILPDDPRFKGETELWKSDNPFLALLSIRIPIDEGSVICSDYNNLKAVTESNWKFTTITTPSDVDGTHPVSGNREFGYFRNDNGSYTFYTRGVDRLQFNYIFKEKTVDVYDDTLSKVIYQRSMYYLNKKLSNFAFNRSDALWRSFQSGVQNFVTTHSGRAQTQTSKSARYDWDKVKVMLDRKTGRLSEAIVIK